MSLSIRAQVVELGRARHEAWWAARHAGEPTPPQWNGCPLVNPLCPDDLCVLPAGHVGTKEGYHTLGTDNYEQPCKITKHSPLFRAPEGTPYQEVVEMGANRAWELWPRERNA